MDEDGSCCWSTSDICKQCPLSKLKKREDGTYYSCVDVVKIDGKTEAEADARYKEIASKILTDIVVEEYVL